MKRYRVALSLLTSAAIVAAGVTVLLGVAHSNRRSAEVSAVDIQAAKRPNVHVQILEPALLQDTLLLTGSIRAWEEVTLSAETAGRIEWQGVDDGDPVTARQELVRVDTESLRARLDQAQAQFRLTEQELARAQALRKTGVSSSQELDRMQADRDVAASSVRVSEIALSKSVVRAPLDGLADRVFREVGEFVDVGAPLVRVVQVDRVKIVVGVPEKEVPLFAVGDEVVVQVDALPGEEYKGTIFRIATTAELATRTFSTEVAVDNASGRLRPGMIARVRFVRHRYPDAISVPIYSIIARENSRMVFVEEAGKASARPVEVGFYQSDMVHVTAGLHAGDRVIVVGQRDLRDGEEVLVQEVVE
jgi:membrane fusion protein, multidrug efflux system